MNKEKQKIIPTLRFPEFKNDGDWEIRSVEKNIDMISGIAIKSKELSEDKSGTPILRGINITEGHIRHSQKIDRFYIGDTTKINKYLVDENDIVIGMDGSKVGKNVALVSKLDIGSILIQRVARIRAIDSDIKYLYQNFIYQRFITYVDNVNTSSGIPHISAKQIKDFIIGFPPKVKEQQKIASCLSSLDTLITAETEKIDHLKKHKKGLLQQLFPAKGETKPQFSFPEFENQKEWKDVKLIDVTDKKKKWNFTGGPFGSNLKSSDYVEENGGVRIIQLQNIGDGEFKNDYKIYTSKEKADELLSCNIYPGDIIMSKMGDPVGRACLIPDYHNRYVMSSDGIRIAVDEDKYDKYFIYLLINSKTFRSKVENASTGSTRKRIGLIDLKKLTLTVPEDKGEQQKIASCLSSVDDLIVLQTTKIEALKKHKKGLMQQLFPNII